MNKFLSDYLEDKLSVSKFPIFWDKPNNCEDFIVEEITNDGHLIELNKRYQKQDSAIPNKKFHLHFAMQKTNWSTNDALRAITRQLRIGKKRYSYAGTKDKHAISTQVASLFAVRKQDMERLRIKDITILGMWYENDKIRMGDLIGNRFTITINRAHKIREEVLKKIEDGKNKKRKQGIFLPNYFGLQRFGSSRHNTHIIGYHILKGEFDKAIWNYLAYQKGETNEKAIEFRKILVGYDEIHNINERHWNKLIRECPKHLRYEKILMSHLAKPTRRNDFVNALKKLPRGILLMFIHAIQSWIFNEEIRRRINDDNITPLENEKTCGIDSFGFPDISNIIKTPKSNVSNTRFTLVNIIGYASKINNYEKSILDEIGISTNDFKIKKMPELSSKGTMRTLTTPVIGLEITNEENNSKVRFSLPSGSYATSIMAQLIQTR